MNAGGNVALPKFVETPTFTFEWVAAANIEVEHERVSSDLDRRDSFSCSTNSTRSSMDGPHEQGVGDTGLPGPRPSFDSGRSSFDQPDEDASSYHPRPKLDKYLSSCSGVSNRSSLRDYLAMERPGVSTTLSSIALFRAGLTKLAADLSSLATGCCRRSTRMLSLILYRTLTS